MFADQSCSPTKNHIIEKYQEAYKDPLLHLNPNIMDFKQEFQTLLQKKYHQKDEEKCIAVLLALIDDILAKEEHQCKESFVFYFGAGFAGSFITELRRYLKPTEFHNITEFTEAALTHASDKAHFDRDPEVRANLKSVSTSLASFGSNESAIDAFIEAKNINVNIPELKRIIGKILKDRPSIQVQQVQKLVDQYQNKIHRSLVQIFIHKDTVEQISYLSRPFGLPIEKVSEIEVLEAHNIALKNLQTYAQSHHIDRRLNVYNYANSSLKDSGYEDYFQARILVTSPLFYNSERVSEYFYYPPEEAQDAEKMREQLTEIFGAQPVL